MRNSRLTPWLTVVGIGEDGFAGLGESAREHLRAAQWIVGSARQLALLPKHIQAQRNTWPSPFSLREVLARSGVATCVLASGDPMWFGVGASLAALVNPAQMQIIPAPSAIALAAARLGWPLQDTTTLSLVGRALAPLHLHLHTGARLFLLSADAGSPAAIAKLLVARGFGASRMTLLEHLGGPLERRLDTMAQAWLETDTTVDAPVAALNLVALECIAGPSAQPLALLGLPDSAFAHDGQLTKRDVRAITLARLAPLPGQLLWDVGAGCGSIGIEWMRAHPRNRAIAIEADSARQALITHNSETLGVPGLRLIEGTAPAALMDLPTPDAIFIGGGVTAPGVLEQCWAQLCPGGRLIANAVTLQSEATLIEWRERHGGELTRIGIAQAQPLGDFDSFRPALPITLLDVVKPWA